eukprot:gnl/MRDRNA2_/MRDRNA2_177379_c0_seq1.p1 gnl/MRDRNA2_/MRDRNA2_177379_c0~~gnl/MRDRNA2_/MRDRNA2_177379_c0_seq1.p1  ORF type:complete len:284 (-),score=40.10 gnl/MRDRNA2_/MRDRNA2_177379_c0_seq1:52-873(-)
MAEENNIVVEDYVRHRFSGKRVLITGCSRGLGLALVKHFVAAEAHVIATCREPAKASELTSILSVCPEGTSALLACDVTSEDSIQAMVKAVTERFGTIDLLFNNAGVSSSTHPIDSILNVSSIDMLNVLQTNVVGTVRVTQALLPLLKAVPKKDDTLRRTIVNMSSNLGSIANAHGDQSHWSQHLIGLMSSYRVSRAANNMAMRTFASELAADGFLVVAMSPGHVDTDMGSAGGRKAPLTCDESVSQMLQTLAKAQLKDNGAFLHYDGKVLDW